MKDSDSEGHVMACAGHERGKKLFRLLPTSCHSNHSSLAAKAWTASSKGNTSAVRRAVNRRYAQCSVHFSNHPRVHLAIPLRFGEKRTQNHVYFTCLFGDSDSLHTVCLLVPSWTT